MSNDMLVIDGLTKTYPGGKRAVDGLSLRVRPGEIYGFIGHNGAGKSTTIRAVCGVMDFDGGTITIDGMDVRTQALACKQRIAYIPDNPDLYEFMTGKQYIALIAANIAYSIHDARRSETNRQMDDFYRVEYKKTYGLRNEEASIANGWY